jgi:hypothetical protein
MNPATERHPGPAAETVCPDRAAAMRAPGDLGRADREPQVIVPQTFSVLARHPPAVRRSGISVAKRSAKRIASESGPGAWRTV